MQTKENRMPQKMRWPVLLITLLLSLIAGTVAAQSDPAALTAGQPAFGTIAQPGDTLTYSYTLAEPRAVTLQAIGETAQPILTILEQGAVIATQPNAEGQLVISLTAFLDAGSYTVHAAAANGTSGTLILVVESEAAIPTTPLQPDSPLTGSVLADAPIALYTFNALAEPAYLYIDTPLTEAAADIRLRNLTTGALTTLVGADALAARLRLPAGSATYQIEVLHTGADLAQPYSLCLTALSTTATPCLVTPPIAVLPAITPEVFPATACTVTPNTAGGANIRFSADINAPVVTALPAGASAQVIGISPAGNFYNVLFNNINGWVALIAVTAAGDCANLPVINPPPFATATPIPPTAAPTVPPPTAPPTASGPCLITMTGEALVYTQPNAIPDYIFDEVQPGYQLIPIGRLADNSFWKTNYSNAWIQTSLFGSVALLSGNCNALPIVSS